MGTGKFIHHKYLYMYRYTIYHISILGRLNILLNVQKISTYVILYLTKSVLGHLASVSGISLTYGGKNKDRNMVDRET